ncbi:MAG: hypothetical protein V2A79_14715 [Planctomycetota bacterium]
MGSGVDLSVTASLGNSTLRDLLRTTQENLPWDGKFETLLKYNDYMVVNQWFRQDKVMFDGGTAIVRNVQLTENGTARMTQPYEPAAPATADVQGRLRANWVQATADYSVSRQEMLRNRGKAKLIDLVKSKRIACMADLANLLEEQAWAAPSSSSDTLNAFGIPYFLVPITGAQVTAATHGHQGTYLSGFSDCFGIDPAQTSPDASRWKSYNDVWTTTDGSIAAADVIKMTRMLRRLRFTSPYIAGLEAGTDRKTRLYAVETVVESLEQRARQNNDSLGADVGMFAGIKSSAGGPLVSGIPVETLWVEVSTYYAYPLIAINHDYCYPFVMEGDFFRETPDVNDRSQHDVFTTFEDIQFNFVCINRQRAGGVISYVAAA